MSEPASGHVEPALAAELPGLSLRWATVAAAPGATPAPVRRRLAILSDRMRGADAVMLRTRPIVAAYRSLYRQLGLDPDRERVAAEQLAVQRLMGGGLACGERIADACRLAVAETQVPVLALDGSVVDGPSLAIRLRGGELVLADGRAVHGPLFGEPAAGCAPRRQTTIVLLVSVGAPGVPAIATEEALWTAGEPLGA